MFTEQIKKMLKEKGLPVELSPFVEARVSEENQIEGVVNELTEQMPKTPNTFDEILQQNPEFQSEFDRRLKQAQDTREQNIRKQLEQNGSQGQQNQTGGNSEGSNGDSGQGEGTDSETMKIIQELRNEVKNLKQEKNQESKQEQAKQLLKDNGLTEKELKFVNLDAENLENEVKELKQHFDQVKQDAIKEQVGENGYTPNSSQSNPDESVVEQVANSKNQEEKQSIDIE